jgi:hypothetical protein
MNTPLCLPFLGENFLYNIENRTQLRGIKLHPAIITPELCSYSSGTAHCSTSRFPSRAPTFYAT